MSDISDSASDEFYSLSSSASSEDLYCETAQQLSPDLPNPSPTPLLSDILDTTFSQFPKNFNITHINCQSIPGHYSEILASFTSDNIHACLFTETFLKPSLPSTLYSLPGYKLIRNDRIGRGSGGVAIYLRSNIPHKVISKSPSQYTASAEYVLVEISINHTKLLLGVFYCPPTINYFGQFEELLSNLLPDYTHTVIIGDFNTCLLKHDSRSRNLLSILRSHNLTSLSLNPTYHVNTCHSLLDLIITSHPQKVSNYGQLTTGGFVNHDLLFISFKLKPPRQKAKFLLQRNFKDMDLDSLKTDAGAINWTGLRSCGNIDDKVTNFTSTIIKLYDKHAPVRTIRLKYPPSPWLDDGIRRAMAVRDKFKIKHKLISSDENLACYRAARNQCNRMCRDAKRRHVHESIDNCPPNEMWKFLNTLGVGKSKTVEKSNIDLNSLNSHFSSPPVSIDAAVKAQTILDISSNRFSGSDPFLFTSVSDCEIRKIILSITSKAVGTDEISRAMLLPILDELLPIVSHIINYSLEVGCFPQSWKNAFVIPLPKINNPITPSEFRPISILPFLSKVLERVVHSQLNSYLLQHSLLNSFQSGFRPCHSTSTALVKVTDDIRHAMDNKHLTILTLLDFSNAFNSVDFDILMAILRSLNMSQSALGWFDTYLRGRQQRVRIENEFSNWCNLVAGVPQGGVLSPLLFSVFINTIVLVLLCLYHLYADDLQLYRHFLLADLLPTVDLVNSDLDAVRCWAEKFGLKVNPTKSQVIIVGSRQLLSKIDRRTLPPIYFNGVIIPYSSSVKNLGVYMEESLSWVGNTNEISRKVYGAMHSLKRLNRFIPIDTKITLVQTLILPILDYGDVCNLDLNENLLNKLDRLLNYGIRFIFNVRKYDHISEYRNRLQWLNVRLRRNMHVLSLLYTILFNTNSPPYLTERFQYLSSHGVPLRSADNLLLLIPCHTSTCYSDSFTVNAARLWNDLPLEVRNSPSIVFFKKRLKEYYLNINS